MKLLSLFITTIISAAMAFGTAQAQSYPQRPIKLIVPFPPGGSADIVARVIADPLSKTLGQTVFVENKAGATGAIGTLEVVRSPKDGYTIGIATVSSTAINPAINPNIGYNPLKDFQAITNIASAPNVLTVNNRFPAKDYKSFIALIQQYPNKYSYASSGTGGIGHMQTELFKSLTNTSIVHVPYKGAGPAMIDTAANHVQILFDNLPSSLTFIKDGRLVPIAVAAPNRLALLPGVPTFAELGLVPVNRMVFYGLIGPAGMPMEATNKLHAAVQKILQDPIVKKRIEDTGSFIVGNTPEQFATEINTEYKVYKDLVLKTKITLD